MQDKNLSTDNQKKSLKMVSIFVFGGLMVISIMLCLYHQEWTGFKGKTLWDWLDLFLIPLVLVLFIPGAHWVVRKAQERQAKMELEIARDYQREEMMKNYIEYVTGLILEKKFGSQEGQDE